MLLQLMQFTHRSNMGKYTVHLEEQNKVDNLLFDLNSCWRHWFSDKQKVCIPIGLSFFSALLLLVSCFSVIAFRRCRMRGRNSSDEAAGYFYCFLGNVCNAVGAILSNQLALQVLMGGFMAAVDAVHLISILFPICLCWNSRTEKRLRMMRKRRRQNLIVVSLLLVVVVGGGSYLNSRAGLWPADRPFAGRILLNYLLQDNTKVLGYVLGLLSFVIAWTSRFPALSRAHRGEMGSTVHVSSTMLCSLAGVLYTSAILLYDTQYEFVLRAMPWLLTSTCSAALDLVIVVLSWCRRGTRQQSGGRTPDTESLLGDSSPPSQNSPRTKTHKKHTLGLDGAPPHAPSNNNNLTKMTDMGHYMDVNIQPVRKVCLKEVTLSREGVSKSQPLKRTVRVVRVDETCFLDSSTDSSSLNSDLEWDFEEAHAQWSKTQKEQERVDEFPLQEWPKNPN